MRLCGGAKLAAWLVAEIDELILQITPVLIGSAIRVAGTRAMNLAEQKIYTNGFALTRYDFSPQRCAISVA